MPRPEVLLRVVTANAASGRDDRGRVDHRAWAAAVGRTQRDLDADVWAVQEVDRSLPRSGAADQTAEVGRVLAGDGSTWHSWFAAAVHGEPGSVAGVAAAAQDDPPGPSYGVALHSRLPVLARRELHLPPSRLQVPLVLPPDPAGPAWAPRVLWVADEPRVAAAVVLGAGPGERHEVTVVTTHLSFAPWQARSQLRELLAWTADLPRPLVLLGDLNLGGRTPARLTGLRPPDPGGVAPTYPATRPRRRIDHVLLDPGDPGDPTHGPGLGLGLVELGTPRIGASDHLGLAAELRAPAGWGDRAVGGRG